ncbi:hypothetical protein ACLOJK_014920 [Asimina triloba]
METRSGEDAAHDPIDVIQMVPSAAELALKTIGSGPSITTSASVDQGDGLLASDECGLGGTPSVCCFVAEFHLIYNHLQKNYPGSMMGTLLFL